MEKGKERMAAGEVEGLKAKVCLCGAVFLPWLLSCSRGVGPQPFAPRGFGIQLHIGLIFCVWLTCGGGMWWRSSEGWGGGEPPVCGLCSASGRAQPAGPAPRHAAPSLHTQSCSCSVCTGQPCCLLQCSQPPPAQMYLCRDYFPPDENADALQLHLHVLCHGPWY